MDRRSQSVPVYLTRMATWGSIYVAYSAVDETATFLILNMLVSSIYDCLLLQLQCHTLAVTLRPFLAIFRPLPINSEEYLQFLMIFTYFRPTSAFFGNFQQYYLYQDSSRSFPTTFGSFLSASSPRTWEQ